MDETINRPKVSPEPAVDHIWQHLAVLPPDGGTAVDMLVTPDGSTLSEEITPFSGKPREFFALLDRPAVSRGPDGSPKLSITFVLSNQPQVTQPDITGLVERGVLSIELTCLPPEWALVRASSDSARFRPLFPREATFSLVDLQEGRTLGEITVHNGQANAAFGLSLGRKDALRLIDGLNGRPTALLVDVWVKYRVLDKSESSSPPRWTSGGVEIHAPLEDVLSRARQGRPTDEGIHLVSPGRDLRGFSEVPRLARSARARPGPPGQTVPVVKVGTAVSSISYALMPSGTITAPAHTILATQGVQGRLSAQALHDLQIVLGNENPKHLPIIGRQADDPPWPDRIDGTNRMWYAPSFVLAQPDRTVPRERSPFLFSFRTTGHDPSGRPSLEGTITLRLHQDMPESLKRHADELGRNRLVPVAARNLSCLLEIPFRDERGALKREGIRASETTESGGEVLITFRLVNDWVRLAYGGLAFPDFQGSEPVRLSVAYTFDAYTEIGDPRLEIVAGGKSARLPLIDERRSRDSLGDQDYLSLSAGTIHLGGTELKLNRPKAARAPAPVRPAFALSSPTSAVNTAAFPVVRPGLQVAAPLATILRQKRYAQLTRAHRDVIDVLIPCTDFGTLYVQERDTGPQSIGCNDAFTLGRTEYRLYEQLPVSIPGLRVMRSLQTPGRFLAVPDSYAITRFGPAEGEKAFRPSVTLYSTIDIDDLSKSRCVIMATLQAQVPTFERQRLLDELRRSYHPDPVVEYPTEIDGEYSFDWALPSTGPSGLLRLESEAVRLWDSFQVSLVTDAVGVPQLQEILTGSGISGNATLRLGDGTSLRSSLLMDLSRITGPWETGPVTVVDSENGNVVLHNRIEATVTVSDLLVIREGGIVSTVPIEARMAGDAQTTVRIDVPFDRLMPVYAVEPSLASLMEIRSFIEDIEINLALVNQVSLADAGLKSIRIDGRLQGGAEEHAVTFDLASALAASLDFLLPLTQYLSSPVVELRATVTDTSDRQRQLSWTPWPLSRGVIVEITPEFIGV